MKRKRETPLSCPTLRNTERRINKERQTTKTNQDMRNHNRDNQTIREKKRDQLLPSPHPQREKPIERERDPPPEGNREKKKQRPTDNIDNKRGTTTTERTK